MITYLYFYLFIGFVLGMVSPFFFFHHSCEKKWIDLTISEVVTVILLFVPFWPLLLIFIAAESLEDDQ